MRQIGFFVLLIQFLILTVLTLILRHNLLHDPHNRHVIKCLRSRQHSIFITNSKVRLPLNNTFVTRTMVLPSVDMNRLRSVEIL